jgi:chaperonin cofactor prefoldin
VRVATIRSLAVMGEHSNVLTSVYKTDTDEDVRKAVLDVLVVQQNSDALSELARDEPDTQRKQEILSRLATIAYRKIQRPPP